MDDCRLSVAPLRYGAGVKGKLIKCLANGLPSVATTLAVEGMDLEHEQHILIADQAESFAQCTVRLFRDKKLWHKLRDLGYAFAEENFSWERSLETCKRILDVADETWIARRVAARESRLAKIFSSKNACDDDAETSPSD
jgi:glycosyltransferase involved in cell wall biosynthesis